MVGEGGGRHHARRASRGAGSGPGWAWDCGRDDVVGWAGEIGREWRQEEKMVMGESWMAPASLL